jgi:uncharacterized membrane protein
MDPLLAMDCAIFGGLVLAIGLTVWFHCSKKLPGLQRWCDLGLPFTASALAVFGMQHLLGAQLLVEVVPPWMLWRLFWVYFVGLALVAAALSFTLRRAIRFSAPLLALLFLLLALLTDLPAAITEPRQWIGWSMLLRELSYAGGALAVAIVARPTRTSLRTHQLFAVARWTITLAILYFAFEQLAFPQLSPGVPDVLLMPSWVLVPRLLTRLSGLVLATAGALLTFRRFAAYGATLAGAWMVSLTVGIYMPIMCMKLGTAKSIEGVDFAFDTFLFAGTALSLGRIAVGMYAAESQEAGSGMHQYVED